METVLIKRRSTIVKATIDLGGSKSISNRLLIIKNLSGSDSKMANFSLSDDSRRLKNSLQSINTCASSRIPLVIDAGNAGTVFRFLTAYLSQKEGKWLLTGSKRMLERPVGVLADALKKLGANISYASSHNYPPLIIHGGLLKGGELLVDSSVSSQFVSSLMMIGPTLKGGLKIELQGDTVSFPYISLTAEIMRRCGVHVEFEENTITIREGQYQMKDFKVEPDWSSASYWYEIAALADDSDIFLQGFTKNSIQGDRVVANLFSELGVKTEFRLNGIALSGSPDFKKEVEMNLSGQPDLVPAILATCSAKGIHARITGIDHLRFKESNRIKSLDYELTKTGADINYSGGVLEFTPGEVNPSKNPEFDTHDDHRIAMCLAPLALQFDSVSLNDPRVVEKSYPEFWKDLEMSGLFIVDKK